MKGTNGSHSMVTESRVKELQTRVHQARMRPSNQWNSGWPRSSMPREQLTSSSVGTKGSNVCCLTPVSTKAASNQRVPRSSAGADTSGV